MSSLSKLLSPVARSALCLIPRRAGGGHRVFEVKQGSYMTQRLRDHSHFYFFMCVGPFALLSLYVHSTYGPCELRPIPEGYEPEHWEYDRHPVTQFLVRYLYSNPQKQWEKLMSVMQEEVDRTRWRKIEQRVRHLMYERQDYRSWWYRPFSAKWVHYNEVMYKNIIENHQIYQHARDV